MRKFRRPTVPAVIACLIVAGCASVPPSEFAGSGRIRGSLTVGHRVLDEGWVEMVELTGSRSERCGPGACGLAVQALRQGEYWNPGRWRVIPPAVAGWKADPLTISVAANELTTFTIRYEPA